MGLSPGFLGEKSFTLILSHFRIIIFSFYLIFSFFFIMSFLLTAGNPTELCVDFVLLVLRVLDVLKHHTNLIFQNSTASAVVMFHFFSSNFIRGYCKFNCCRSCCFFKFRGHHKIPDISKISGISITRSYRDNQ